MRRIVTLKSVLNEKYILFLDEYTCTLKETWQKKARDELNEDEVERLPSVQALREWIHQQKWLKTPTGKTPSDFLLCTCRDNTTYCVLDVNRFIQARSQNLLLFSGTKSWKLKHDFVLLYSHRT